jgi:hypothetical protein
VGGECEILGGWEGMLQTSFRMLSLLFRAASGGWMGRWLVVGGIGFKANPSVLD